MESTIFTIDAYLSNQERADVCQNLIQQIRKLYPTHKILLINKYNSAWGLDAQVDHYYYYGEGFMVGYPPKHILESGKYEMPYTYVKTHQGTFENWFPLVNVTDHVAGIFNSFVISARLAKMLGFDKIVKIEYDTIFDETEFINLQSDIACFEDYLFYGTRKEGEWAQPHQYLVDVHIIGYSAKLFDSYGLVKNDDDYWNLCERINYYGKWIEYIIPAVVEERKALTSVIGTDIPGKFNTLFEHTQFDVINSPSEWSNVWKHVPKLCKAANSAGPIENLLLIFYWNNNEAGVIKTRCVVQEVDTATVIYEKEIDLIAKANWLFDSISLTRPVQVTTWTTTGDETVTQTQVIDLSDLQNLAPRFLFND